MPKARALPTARQAAKGVSVATHNAWTHIECAETLHGAGHFGAASAHSGLAVEEAVKARVLYQWQALLGVMTPAQLRELLSTHRVRHEIAVHDSITRPMRTAIALWHVDHPGQTIDHKSLSRLLSRHSVALPTSWADRAEREKHRGLYVDWGGRAWKTPATVTEAQYRRRFV